MAAELICTHPQRGVVQCLRLGGTPCGPCPYTRKARGSSMGQYHAHGELQEAFAVAHEKAAKGVARAVLCTDSHRRALQ